MWSFVDVELRHSTIELFLKYLVDEGLKNSEPNKDKSVDQGVQDFLSILQNVVQHKLESKTIDRIGTSMITSRDFVLEGQGSVEITDPPTEAQHQLIRSLLRVVLHQYNNKKRDFFDTDDNYNLLLSVFVKKITIETEGRTYRNSHIFSSSAISVEENVAAILEGNDKTLDPSDSPEGYYKFYFFILPDQTDLESSNILSSDFRKIGLQDTNDESLDESTFILSSTKPEELFSEETLKNVKVTRLPSPHLEGLWESLYFGNDIKQKIFSHGQVSMKINEYLHPSAYKEELSKLLVNNKVILLHGPPGTGKTTLCRSLAQKLIIRKKYPDIMSTLNTDHKGILVELSCARVFSRWFGESSKNLESIFTDLKRILSSRNHRDLFVCVLIDEVETIAGSRKDILSKNESSDSIRVVNTLLTQIDSLKSYKNFLILATSNMVESLDPAFVDRADGVFYIGSPSIDSISNILFSLINSLIEINIISCSYETKGITDKKYSRIINKLGQQCVVCIIIALHF